MNPKIAYLEISPRQTGKTKRLTDIANQLKSEGKTVVFVTLPPLVESTRMQMPGVIVLADGEAPPPDTDSPDTVWMYDEFDWLHSTEIRNGAYYATTAKYVRALGVDSPENDLLLELIELNGGRFDRHFWFFGLRPDSWFSDARASYSSEQFRALILGEFLQ